MTSTRFKPGDRIVGNSHNPYGHTGVGSICEVVKINSRDEILVRVLVAAPTKFAYGGSSETFFPVGAQYFYHLYPKSNREALYSLRSD